MTLRLLLLSPRPGLPSQCLEFDTAGAVRGRAWLHQDYPATAAFATPATHTVLAIPGTEASALWLDVPAHSTAQALAAARLMLEERLARTGEHLHLAIGPRTATATRLVVLTRHAAMQAWLEQAALLDVVPDVVLPDYLLLPASQDETVRVVEAGDRWLVRGQDLAFTAEATLAERILGERPRVVLGGEQWEQASAASARVPDINLLQQDFAPATSRPQGMESYRRSLWLALALLLSPLLLSAAQALRYESAARSLERQAAQLAGPVLHGDQEVPAGELLARLHALRAPEVHAGATQALFSAVASMPGARLEKMEYALAEGFRATLVHRVPGDLDTLRAALAAGGWQLVAGGSIPDADGLRSELLLEPES